MNNKKKAIIVIVVFLVVAFLMFIFRGQISNLFLQKALQFTYSNNLNTAKIYLNMAGILERGARYHYLAGNLDLLGNIHEGAVGHYSEALNLGFTPREWVLIKRASIYRLYLVDYNKALADYLEIENGAITNISTNQDGALIFFYQPLAEVYIELNKLQDAINSINKIIDLTQSNESKAHNYEILGRAEYLKRDFTASAAAYKKSLELNPEQPRVAVNFARALKNSGDTKRAMSEINKLLEKDPNYQPAYCALAGIYNKTKEYDKSMEAAQRGFSGGLNNLNVSCFYHLALAQYSKKDFMAAKVSLKDMLDSIARLNLTSVEFKDLKSSAQELLSKMK